MSTWLCRFLAVAGIFGSLVVSPGATQEPGKSNPEEEALLKRAQAFTEAFGKGDAAAVAGFWTPDGDYTDLFGKQHKGREAIQKSFAEFFAVNKGLTLRIEIDSVKFVSPEVAIEDGVSSVIPPDGGPPSRSRATVVHVKKDGQWYFSSVRDSIYHPPSNVEHLAGLEWMIGDWIDEMPDKEAKGPVAHASFSWGANQNFLVSSFATTFENLSVAGGTQFIGWDPEAKSIRSWTFENNGGFGTSTWTKEGDNKWIINTKATMRDGKKVVATNIVTRVDADTISWESKERSVDGNTHPDLPAVRMKRRK